MNIDDEYKIIEIIIKKFKKQAISLSLVFFISKSFRYDMEISTGIPASLEKSSLKFRRIKIIVENVIIRSTFLPGISIIFFITKIFKRIRKKIYIITIGER